VRVALQRETSFRRCKARSRDVIGCDFACHATFLLLRTRPDCESGSALEEERSNKLAQVVASYSESPLQPLSGPLKPFLMYLLTPLIPPYSPSQVKRYIDPLPPLHFALSRAPSPLPRLGRALYSPPLQSSVLPLFLVYDLLLYFYHRVQPGDSNDAAGVARDVGAESMRSARAAKSGGSACRSISALDGSY
jgi:hypothetical protein